MSRLIVTIIALPSIASRRFSQWAATKPATRSIRSGAIGLYRSKAKNIRATGAILAEKFEGKVPAILDELIELPGVGRKTANVVLGNAYGLNVGVVVDTHVARLSARLGMTRHTDPQKIEGYEPSVVAGMSQLLKHPIRIIMEFSPLCLKSGNTDPKVFLQSLSESFDFIYVLDDVSNQHFRYLPENAPLETKILSAGFNLLLCKGEAPRCLSSL